MTTKTCSAVSALPLRISFLALLGALAVHAPEAAAAVHRCIAAYGKVVFSDRPCEPGAGDVVATPAATAPAAAKAASRPAAADAPIDSATRAACRKMREQIASWFFNGAGATPIEEIRATQARFEAECQEVARQEMAKADADKAKREAPKRAAEDAQLCKAMREDVRLRRLEHEAMTRQGQPPSAAEQGKLAQAETLIAVKGC